jgi:uncharacterized protein
MELFHCFRCGNVWRPRRDRVKVCPLCKSRLWNVPRSPTVRPFDPENRAWQEIVVPHRVEILRAAARHHATHVRVFGSVRRGDATGSSDLDLLVRMRPEASVLDQIALARELEGRLKRRVDVVNDDSVYWYVEPQIQAEAIPL